MTPWWEALALWLADYYLLATLLLALAFAALALVRQPARRLAVAWGTLGSLLLLAVLIALPGWPRLSLSPTDPPDPVGPADRFILVPEHGPLGGKELPRTAEKVGAGRKDNRPVREISQEELRKLLAGPTAAASGKPAALRPGAEVVGAPPPGPARENRPSVFAPRTPRSLELLELAVPVFLAGSVLALTWMGLGAAQIRKVCRKGCPAPADLQDLLRQVAGPRRRLPRLLLSTHVNQPVALGTLRPAILLPARAAEGIPERQLEAVLAHEWAHIRRGDLWLLALARWLLAVLYLHPLYYWLRGRIREDQETLADAAAAARSGPIDYAATLLTWVRQGRKRRPAQALAMGGRPSELKRRILMLLHPQFPVEIRCPRPWRWGAWSLVTLGVLALSLLTVRPLPPASAAEQKAKTADGTKKDVKSDVKDTEAKPLVADFDDVVDISNDVVFSNYVAPVPATAPKKTGAAEVKVAGRVLDPEKKSVAGARVVVVALGQQAGGEPQVLAETKTDSKGRFALKVKSPAGRQVVALVHSQGYGLAWQFFPAKPDPVIALKPEQVIHGRLIDLQGQPAANVKVEVSRLGDLNAGGRNRALGYYYPAKALVIRQNGTSMAMPNRNKAKDQPAPPPTLHFLEPPAKLPLWPQPVNTDAQGRFVLRGIDSNQPVAIQVRDPRYARQVLEIKPPEKGKTAEATLVVSQARSLEGTVVDADTGRPIPGVRLILPPQRSNAYGNLFVTFSGTNRMGVADWKGRHASNPYWQTIAYYDASGRTADELPGAEVRTDKEGHFNIPLYLAGSYNLSVTPPEGEPYFPTNRAINWPRAAAHQQIKIALVRGVWVRGKVQDKTSGKPVANARVDFWSPGLKPIQGISVPSGVNTKADGTFQVLLPPGSWQLLVNGPTPEYLVQKIPAAKVTGKGTVHVSQPNGTLANVDAADKKQFFYPDGWAALDLKPRAPAQEASISLSRVVLKGKVVGPDGKPVGRAVLFYRHPLPVNSPAVVNAGVNDAVFVRRAYLDVYGYLPNPGQLASAPDVLQTEVRDGGFELPLSDLDAKYTLYILDAAHNLAAVAEVTGRKGLDQPPTVRLVPCGSARARFLDEKGKPLVKFQPALWMLLPPGQTGGPAVATNPSRSAAFSPDGQVLVVSDGTVRFWNVARADGNVVPLSRLDPLHYGKGLATDAKGELTFFALIPGATYRLLPPNGKAKDFRVEPGKVADLGDFTIQTPKPQPTYKVPVRTFKPLKLKANP